MSGETRARGAPLRPDDPQRLGSYELRSRLGEGGMGVVYLAVDADGRQSALKLIRSDLAGEPEFRRRFRSEVARAAAVPPFCTAEVLDSDPDHDPPYLVVEYVDGPSLAEVVVDRGPLSASNLHALAIGVATALTAIHGAGVIHRDLKPSNVLLAPGSPKVIDFGIARAADSTDGDTRTDQLIGTVAYMAPERLDPVARQPVTAASDVFAWGAVVTFAATSRAPFVADSSPATAVAILTREPDLTGLAEPLRSVVARALGKEPNERPTARELLDELLNMSQLSVRRAASTGSGDEQQMTTGAAAARIVLESPTAQPSMQPPAKGPDVPRQSRPTRVGDPEEGIATDVAASTKRRLSAMRRIGVAAPVILVVALGVAIAGVLRGDIRLGHDGGESAAAISTASASTSPAATPSSATPATPSASPSPSTPAGSPDDPFPGGVSFFDALTTAGNWVPTSAPDNFDSSCEIDGGLVASVAGYSSYRCEGYVTNVGDLKLSADITLLRAASCASIWFHFTGQVGPQHGYALLICPDGMSLRTHTDQASGGGELISNSNALSWNTIKIGKPTHIDLTVIGNFLSVDRDGTAALRQATPAYPYGRIILGIYQPRPRSGPGVATPPDGFYSVRFNNLHIWSPAGGGPPSVTPSP